MSVESRNDYLDNLLRGREAVADAGSPWQRTLRMRAVERANELTVPTTRDEEWRFTDLSPLYRIAFGPAASAGIVEKSQIDAFAIPEAETRLVFLDGCYSAGLSHVNSSDGVTVGNLADVSGSSEAVAQTHLAQLAAIEEDVFAAVNTAFLRDGALIHVARNRVVNAPIHLLFVATRKDSAAYPRVLVVTETGAQCTVVEDFVGVADGAYLTDAVSEFYVAENARVSHVKLQRETPTAFHIANTSVRVAHGGHYATWTVALGARISRHNLSIAQAGEGTEFSIDGLALISGRQLADMHSSIDHAHAHGRSRQLHKTVVGGSAHAVFNGKILVRQGAQQTDSGQQSRNLLISDKAHVDTKPQLEIFADDVKCAHGATVGQIEADELFYLKSRGLSDTAARNLLTYAFAAQVIERIPVKSLVDQLKKIVLEQTQTRETA
ncbi:MAG TPA: Fe-S cluster assembly protein SufD [Acidiferrobacterales bacterium]|nr:Fe-S cluster assembly protein SufD [Acidiferrobacterales bacterium]